MRLIDADALKQVFYFGENDMSILGDARLDMKVQKIIDNAPTIVQCGITSEGLPLMDLRPRATGHWIKDAGIAIKCSECNAMYAISIYDKCYDYLSLDYCPHCGAAMEEV